MRRRGRTRIAFRFYLLLFAAMCLLGYGVYIAVDSMVQRTTVIESGNMGNQYTVDAVIVRDEKLTDAEGITSITYFADEGGYVFEGNKIAAVYSSGYSQTDMNKLLSVRAQIKEKHKLLANSVYGDTQLEQLEKAVMEFAREFELVVHGDASGNLQNLERQLQSAMDKRQNYLKTKYATDQNLTSLYENEASLVKKIANWTNNRVASQDCIGSFYTDGYENYLKAADLESTTPTQVLSVLAGQQPPMTSAQRGRVAVYREVKPNGWYLLLISHDATWKPVDGQTLKVQLAGFEDHIVDGTVMSSTRTGNDLLIRLKVNGDVRPVLNIRTSQALVGEEYVSGYKVPLNALRDQGGQVGVVLTDRGGIFVPVEVVTQNNEFAIILPMAVGALGEGQKIRVF